MPEDMPRKSATLYRMALADQTCPSGLRAKDLLVQQGFQVEDKTLTTRAEVDAFKTKHGVATTPQIFTDGVRVGGLEDLRQYLGKPAKAQDTKTYGPVIALFSVAALMALAVSWSQAGTIWGGRTIEMFIAIAMVLLGLQKLQDIPRFATMFETYDLLAQRWPAYSYVYPFVETGAGVLMLAGVLTWLSAPAALLVAGIGAVSVFKAVYLDKRNLNCACVGGDSRVPLGFVSLLENLMMIGMAIWMLVKLVT